MSRVPPSVRGRRLPVACFLVIASVLLALGVSPGPAVAADEHHAAVIVDTGFEVHQVVITFTEDSISGLEALQQAGANPVILGFSGIGGAVCSLYDVGHPATSSTCLGLPDDPRFWAYWHVPSGQSAFNDSTYSRAGAGSVRVRDGDTEGWRYGTGEPPTFVQLAFPEPPAPAATAPPVAGPGPAPSGGSSGAAGGGSTTVTPGSRSSNPSSSNPSSSNPSAVPGSAGVAAASGSTTTTTTGGSKAGSNDETTEVAAEQASATRGSGSSGGTLASLAGFAAVMVILAAGIFFFRRARVGSSTGPS